MSEFADKLNANLPSALKDQIAELEAERDAAKAEKEKWEKRFRWMVKWYCGQLDCDLCVILDECIMRDGEPQYDLLALAADKEP